MLNRITRCTLALFFLVQPVMSQQPADEPVSQDDVIRVETNLVQLRAVVTDKHGRPVVGLKREDFQVLEEGREREVGHFAIDQVSGDYSVGGNNSNAPAISGRSAAGAQPLRTVVLFVDTFHLANSSFMRVKQQLRQIVTEQITDRDLVAIISTDGRLGALQQFTRDRRLLGYAIERLSFFGSRNSHFTPYLAARVTSDDQEAANAALQILVAEESYQPLDQEAALSYVRARAREIINEETNRRRATLQTLQAVAERMASMPGQRIVAVLSDGFTMMENAGGAANREAQIATGSASRAGVVIHSLGVQGLLAPGEFGASSSLNGASMVQVSQYVGDSARDQHEILKTLAYDTGGEAYLNTNSLRESFGKVLDKNIANYLVGYYAKSDGQTGKFRNITIRLKNHPDYTVRSAKGYVPPAPLSSGAETPRQRLLLAMLSPLPVTQIAVTSSADFLERASDQSRITLQVNIDGQSILYEQEGQRYRFQCELAGAIYDSTGKVIKTFIDTVKADLTAEQVELARKTGFRYRTRFEVKPGAYQARVGVRDLGSGLIGTASSWVQVPDVRKGQLTLSSLFLGKDRASEQKSASKPRLIQGRPYYRNTDTVFYRFVVYNVDSPGDAKLRLEVLAGDKPAFASDWQPVSERTIANDSKGTELGGEIRIGLTPGIYTLRATVVNNRTRKTAQQTAYFEVEP